MQIKSFRYEEYQMLVQTVEYWVQQMELTALKDRQKFSIISIASFVGESDEEYTGNTYSMIIFYEMRHAGY